MSSPFHVLAGVGARLVLFGGLAATAACGDAAPAAGAVDAAPVEGFDAAELPAPDATVDPCAGRGAATLTGTVGGLQIAPVTAARFGRTFGDSPSHIRITDSLAPDAGCNIGPPDGQVLAILFCGLSLGTYGASPIGFTCSELDAFQTEAYVDDYATNDSHGPASSGSITIDEVRDDGRCVLGTIDLGFTGDDRMVGSFAAVRCGD